MMHGPLTDDDALTRLRHALQSDTATEPFEIVLYTTNGQFYIDMFNPFSASCSKLLPFKGFNAILV